MLKKRFRQLASFYVILIILVTTFGFGFTTNAMSDQESLNKTIKTIKLGDIFKDGDIISNESYYRVSFSASQKYVSEENSSLGYYDESSLKYYFNLNDEQKKYLWRVIYIDYYAGKISGVSLEPIKKIDLNNISDQNVYYGYSAEFNEKIDGVNNLSYKWYTIDYEKVDDIKYTSNSSFNVNNSNELTLIGSDNGSILSDYFNLSIFDKIICKYNPTNSVLLNVGFEEYSFWDYTDNIFGSSSLNDNGLIQIVLSDNHNNVKVKTELNKSNSDPTIIEHYKATPVEIKGEESNKLVVSPDSNSEYYEDGRYFYAEISDGNETYRTNIATLNVKDTTDRFVDKSMNSSVKLPNYINKDYKFKINNITNSIKSADLNEISSKVEDGYKTLDVFDANMFENDKIVDLGDGVYSIFIEKDNKYNNFTNLRVVGLDSDFNVINTGIINDSDDTLNLNVNHLGKFAIIGESIQNPVTSSPIFIGFVIMIIILSTTVYLELYNKKINNRIK